jgi:WD40 repeat protein
LSYEGCENTKINIPFDNIKLIKNSNNHLVVLGEKGDSYFIKLTNNFSDREVSSINSLLIQDAEISPDGRFIIVLDNDNRISLREWSSNSEPPLIQNLGQADSKIKSFGFSPNGKYLASINNGKLSLRTLDSQGESNFLLSDDYPQQISNFAFSLDSQFLAFVQGKQDNQIKLLNLSKPDSKLIDFKPNRQLSKIDTIIFSPSLSIKLEKIEKEIKLNLIATAESNGKIHLWDFEGREIAVFNSNHNQITELLFSPKRINKQSKKEYPDFLIALERDQNNNPAIQSWNITEELNLDVLLTQGCDFFDQKFLSSNDIKELSINTTVTPNCKNINTSSTSNSIAKKLNSK